MEPQEIQAPIEQVTVFRDGARVVRVGRVKLSAGPHTVVLRGITGLALRDSFRASGRGPARLSGIDVNTYTVVSEPETTLRNLLDEMNRLEKELEFLNREVELQKSRLENVRSMRDMFCEYFPTVLAAGEGDVSRLTTMDSTYSSIDIEANSEIRRLGEEIQKLGDRIEVIRSEVSKVEGEKKTESFYEVRLDIEVKERAQLEFDVTYQVTGVGWTPRYEVDLREGRTRIRRIADVRNRSRENWNKVRFTVSTATATPVEVVEPTPFTIDVIDNRPLPSPRFAKARAGAVMEAASFPEAAPPVEMEEQLATPQETTAGISVYELPGPITIPFDNDPHPVALTEEDLESRTVHYWYADGMSEVVAQDEVTNGDNVLLPGKVRVFAEGDYVGETTIDLVSPREKFKLGTRVATDVKAEKKLIAREVEKAGITKGKLRRSYTYRLEIQNFRRSEIELKLIDRVPHSLSPQIEVKIDFDRLGLTKHNLGIMEWVRKLPPNRKDTIEYSYEVVWDRDVTITPSLA
ncbi:MAG: mucoidy inhibitor MuiA family protein [Candidatus Thorarchaeota archaeon]